VATDEEADFIDILFSQIDPPRNTIDGHNAPLAMIAAFCLPHVMKKHGK
jgi:hypothetical protein